jgi:ribosomal protein S27E
MKEEFPKPRCIHCKNEDMDLMEPVTIIRWYCKVCSKVFEVTNDPLTEGKKGRGNTENKIPESHRR